MKKILRNLLIIFTLFVCCNVSYAKEGIYSIDIDVYVKDNGDANITEIWDCESYSGTEWYHPYYNLGNAQITNLSVSEGEKEYTALSRWNTSATQLYKKEKCGFNKISDGIEICWGMGDYGKHTYEVSYTITNFVDNLKDAQMVYWTLIPHGRSDKVDNASIKIRSDKTFDDNVLVWGFGEDGGVCRVNNGIVEMKSKNGLRINEYMTLLVKFPTNFFSSNNNSYESFDYYYNKAMKGARKTNTEIINMIMEKYMIMFVIFFGILVYILKFLFYLALSVWAKGVGKIFDHTNAVVVITYIIFAMLCIYKLQWWSSIVLLVVSIVADRLIKEYKVIKGRIKESQVMYFRDIPCDGDIFKIYYIAYQYGLIKKESDFLGAVILKWINEGKAKVLDKNGDRKNDGILLSTNYYNWEWDSKNWSNLYEKQLYQMMFEASRDGILEKNELKKWCNNRYSKLFAWFENVMTDECGKLLSTKELAAEYVTIGKTKYKATDKLFEQGRQICGLKKYLKDFTIIHEREPIEVQLFEEYLIIAQILGIAKKVMKQFKYLYPDVIEESRFDYMDYIFVHSISHRTLRHASYRRTVVSAAKAASSSGGGGSSRSGGGGGSRGGGGGGGGRR